jgi:chromate transporter
MQQDLVEKRRWISRAAFVEGLALAQLAPGPLAAQLAIYLGWLRSGALGATLVGAAFVLPSFAIVLVLAVLYVRHGGLPWIQGVFYGIGAAVIAIIARGALKLSRSTLHRDPVLWGVCAVNAAATVATEREIPWVFLASGIILILARRAQPRMTGVAGWMPLAVAGFTGATVAAPRLLEIAGFFAMAGSFVFGSGLAIVPFLRGGLVADHHWLTESQFIDAVAVAMITPGPVVITVAFIGYLIAGLGGATVAATGVFVPAYLVVILLAPHYRRVASNRTLGAFVSGVTAASCGALLGAVVVLGRRAVHDAPTALIAVAAAVFLWRGPRWPEQIVLAAAGLAGLALRRQAG